MVVARARSAGTTNANASSRPVGKSALSLAPNGMEKISRPLAVVHRKGKQFSLAAERFIEFLMSKKAADEPEPKSRTG